MFDFFLLPLSVIWLCCECFRLIVGGSLEKKDVSFPYLQVRQALHRHILVWFLPCEMPLCLGLLEKWVFLMEIKKKIVYGRGQLSDLKWDMLSIIDFHKLETCVLRLWCLSSCKHFQVFISKDEHVGPANVQHKQSCLVKRETFCFPYLGVLVYTDFCVDIKGVVAFYLD